MLWYRLKPNLCGKYMNNTSKQIEHFLNFYTTANNQYLMAYSKVNECDKLTQDLLHKLELNNLSTPEKNKIATQLKYCRKDRRYWKDQVEELESFVCLFDQHVTGRIGTSTIDKCRAEANIRFINLLREALGQTRKQEAYHADRTYKPRVLK